MVSRQKVLLHPAAKPVLFLICLLPFAWLAWNVFQAQRGQANVLGANPAEYLIRATGDWTLRFICIVLAVTPLRVITSTPALVRFRRMLGLFTYFYVVIHLLSYSWFDMGFDVPEIAKDIAKRPFILVGFAAFVLLTPLAATSFNAAIRRRQKQLRGSVCLCGHHCRLAGLAPCAVFQEEKAGTAACRRAITDALVVFQNAARRSCRIWSCESSRCLMRWAFAPSTRISAARPRVL